MLTTKDVERVRFELMAREHVQRIGARIRERREELGLSQGAVADQMPPPIDGNYISRWERGQHKPSDDNLDKLADILKTDRAYFLTDSLKGEISTPDLSSGPSQLDRIEAAIAELRAEVATARDEVAALEVNLTKQLRSLARKLDTSGSDRQSRANG